MTRLDKLRVMRIAKDRFPNPYPAGKLPWQIYQGVRNAVVRTCRKHGPTGPVGEARIGTEGAVDDRPVPLDSGYWEPGDDDPNYYIIAEQYNHERYVYAELSGSDSFAPEWLTGVTGTLGQFPGWGLGVSSIPDGFLLIFGDRLMIKGTAFSRRTTEAAQVVEIARRAHRKGK
jgi:hypothetical protein